MNINNTTVVNSLYGRSISGTSTSPFVDIFMSRDPTPNDIQYSIQQHWLNTTDGHYWELQNFTSTGGIVIANWIKIASTQHVETLTGNSGGAVGPTSNNINVVGDGAFITTVGTPGTSTLTIEPAGGIATSYVENIGTAVPSGGILNVLGADGVATTGSGNTITVGTNGSIATSYVEDVGTAIPLTGVLHVVGGTGATTSGAGNTITISTNGSVATEYATQAGFAIPSGGVLNIVGDDGITTAASGNTVTIHGTGTISSVATQIFTASGTYTPTTGMIFCGVEVVGGGGAGGGAPGGAPSNLTGGSGGGGGGYSQSVFSSATIGVSQAVTVGTGGAGVSGAPGNAGGTSSLGVLVSASGGSGGTVFDDNSGPLSTAGGDGGNVFTGTVQISGTAGGSAFVLNATGLIGGCGGSSGIAGGGGLGIIVNSAGSTTTPGNTGGKYGGGGSGALRTGLGASSAGGNGADGVVIITEYIG